MEHNSLSIRIYNNNVTLEIVILIVNENSHSKHRRSWHLGFGGTKLKEFFFGGVRAKLQKIKNLGVKFLIFFLRKFLFFLKENLGS